METCCSIKHEKTPFYEKTNYIISSLVIGLVLLVLSFVWGSVIGGNHLLMYFNPAWVVIVMCGLPLVVNAGENLFKNKKIKTSLLITTAMIACVVLEILNWCGITENVGDAHSHSNLFAAGEVAFLMMLGELLEDLTVRKSRKGIEKLINLSPTTALVNLEGEYSELPIELVRIGDIVKVLPYQQIPVDGVVKSGNTAVNQSAITGESLPIDIEVGDNVYAGTWNESGAIEIEVKKENDNTTLARMVKLVKDAENNKAPIARLADKWAGYIVPAAIILSVVVLLLSKYVLSVTWSVAVVRSVTVLVVFCP
ncbi:MAG: HAD-IC family P-type ATPase, partial [Clostridia bacterium]